MKPETGIRVARILIPLGIVIGVVAAISGAWLTLVAMVLVVASQVLTFRSCKKRLNPS